MDSKKRFDQHIGKGLIAAGTLVLVLSLLAPAVGQTVSLTLWQTPDTLAVPHLTTISGAPAIDGLGRVHGAAIDAVGASILRPTPSSTGLMRGTR